MTSAYSGKWGEDWERTRFLYFFNNFSCPERGGLIGDSTPSADSLGGAWELPRRGRAAGGSSTETCRCSFETGSRGEVSEWGGLERLAAQRGTSGLECTLLPRERRAPDAMSARLNK